MNLQEKLQELSQQKVNFSIAIHEINGAMKLLEQQILEQQILEAEPESNQPSDIEASTLQEETAPSE